ncbi:MAG TPA: hypothetical protein VNW06_02255 [Cytophagaceae bacterium]|jgi:hypothetical protein|nr:hypothetical protein [Cytophagaceae bacterium]
MLTVHPQYITDTAGKKLVILPMKEFKTIMEELEDLDDIKLYDKAKASKELSFPIDEAFKKIETKRKKKK